MLNDPVPPSLRNVGNPNSQRLQFRKLIKRRGGRGVESHTNPHAKYTPNYISGAQTTVSVQETVRKGTLCTVRYCNSETEIRISDYQARIRKRRANDVTRFDWRSPTRV
jgi:hypothetical protein